MSATRHDQLWRLGALALFCGVPLLLAALATGNLLEASAARAVATRQNATAAQIAVLANACTVRARAVLLALSVLALPKHALAQPVPSRAGA